MEDKGSIGSTLLIIGGTLIGAGLVIVAFLMAVAGIIGLLAFLVALGGGVLLLLTVVEIVDDAEGPEEPLR